MRIFGERRRKDDPTGKRFNLEKACLDGIDLRDEWTVVTGLIGVRLSGASMARVDFTRVEMENAELLGILAGNSLSLGKDKEKGRRLHKGVDGDQRIGTDDGELRRAHIAHFIEAGLEGANLGGAQLAGADFSGARLKGASFNGADISRASFKGAQDLEVKQFENACVGYRELAPDELALEQPYFSGSFRAELAKHPKLRNGVPPCLAAKS